MAEPIIGAPPPPTTPFNPPSIASQAVKDLAQKTSMSEAAAQATVERYQANPNAAEFATLSQSDRQSLSEAAKAQTITSPTTTPSEPSGAMPSNVQELMKSPAVQDFAQKQSISIQAAAETVSRYQQNPGASEFASLKPDARTDLQQAVKGITTVITPAVPTITPTTPKVEVVPPKDALKDFAESRNLSVEAAKATIDRYKANPTNPEFKNLNANDIIALNRLSGIDVKTGLVEIGVQTGGGSFITKSELEKVSKDMPVQADLLVSHGIEAYSQAVKDIGARRAGEIGLVKEQIAGTTIRLGDNQLVDIKSWNKVFEGMPEEQAAKYQKIAFASDGGLEAMKAAMSKDYQAAVTKFEQSNIKLTDDKGIVQYVSIEDWNKTFEGMPEEKATKYQDIAFKRGLDAMRQAMQEDINLQKTAISKLERYKRTAPMIGPLLLGEERPDIVIGYDVAKYLRDNPSDLDTLKLAGYSSLEIKQAQDFNRNYLGVGAPDYVPRNDFIKQYFNDKGWDYDYKKVVLAKPLEQGVLKQEYDQRLIEAKQAHDQMFAAPMSSDQFAERYFADKGWTYDRAKLVKADDYAGLDQYDNRLIEASNSYQNKYGLKSVLESGAGKSLSLAFAPLREITPGAPPLTVEDWTIGGAQVALLLVAPAASMFGKVGGVVARGVGAGATAVFVEHTVSNFNRMSNNERAISIGFDVLIGASVLKGSGAKLVQNTKSITKKLVENIMKARELEVSRMPEVQVALREAQLRQALQDISDGIAQGKPELISSGGKLFEKIGGTMKELPPEVQKFIKDGGSFVANNADEYAKLIKEARQIRAGDIKVGEVLFDKVNTDALNNTITVWQRESDAAIKQRLFNSLDKVAGKLVDTEKQLHPPIDEALKAEKIRRFNAIYSLSDDEYKTFLDRNTQNWLKQGGLKEVANREELYKSLNEYRDAAKKLNDTLKAKLPEAFDRALGMSDVEYKVFLDSKTAEWIKQGGLKEFADREALYKSLQEYRDAAKRYADVRAKGLPEAFDRALSMSDEDYQVFLQNNADKWIKQGGLKEFADREALVKSLNEYRDSIRQFKATEKDVLYKLWETEIGKPISVKYVGQVKADWSKGRLSPYGDDAYITIRSIINKERFLGTGTPDDAAVKIIKDNGLQYRKGYGKLPDGSDGEVNIIYDPNYVTSKDVDLFVREWFKWGDGSPRSNIEYDITVGKLLGYTDDDIAAGLRDSATRIQTPEGKLRYSLDDIALYAPDWRKSVGISVGLIPEQSYK